jgi:hypothetical protein
MVVNVKIIKERKEYNMYTAYVTKLKNIRPHPNADRLNLAECFGNTVVVGKDYDAETLYLYFPVDGQLSEEYATINNLVRKKDDAGNSVGGYLDPDKRNIRAIRLRGEKSDGLVMPLESVAYTGVDMSLLQGEGIVVHMLNGHEICCKYVPRRNPGRSSGNGNRTRKKKVDIAPLFAEHADTEQLAYNLGAFKPGDQIEITLKMHGTSQRTGYLPVLKGYKRNFLDFILRREGTPIYEYDYVSGTRRTVLENYEGGYYGDNEFREQHSKVFEGKLHKGECVYYEVCAFTTNGTPIMSSGKVPKEAQAQYGDTMVFSYGCESTGKKVLYGQDEEGIFSIEENVPQSVMYVYRMTLTTEEGYVIDYTPDYMRYRCEQMGVSAVPVFWTGYIPEYPGAKDDDTISAGEWIKNKAEQYYDGPDPIGKTHVREGVVVRIINRPKFCAYKHKNFLFKQISGIISEKIADSTEITSDDILSEM